VDRLNAYSATQCPITRKEAILTRHTSDCSKYTVCTSDSPTPITCECEPGKKFSTDLGSCFPSEQVEDCPVILSTRIDDSHNCETSGQLLPNPTSCTKYFQCVSLVSGESLLIEYQCPSGHGFDHLTSHCRKSFCQEPPTLRASSSSSFPISAADGFGYFQQLYNVTPSHIKSYKSHTVTTTKSSQRYPSSIMTSSNTFSSAPIKEYFQGAHSSSSANYYPSSSERKTYESPADVPCLRQIEEMNDECPYQGFFPIEQDCRNYMVCLAGRSNKYNAYVIQCPDDKDFSKTYRRCVNICSVVIRTFKRAISERSEGRARLWRILSFSTIYPFFFLTIFRFFLLFFFVLLKVGLLNAQVPSKAKKEHSLCKNFTLLDDFFFFLKIYSFFDDFLRSVVIRFRPISVTAKGE
jgi:hypothetical protein